MAKRVGQTKVLLLYSQQEGKCYYCGQILEMNQDSRIGTSVDHKIPQSRGGTNELENLVLCCRSWLVGYNGTKNPGKGESSEQ
ncbi:MAG: HNH endonuclease [Anaerolineae bacterium]|nr:HNH endonuclease [Anaerolineae bacterium]